MMFNFSTIAFLIAVITMTGCQSFPKDCCSEDNAMPATQTLERPEGTLAYEDRGEGPLLILMPGLGDLRQTYRFLAPQLVEAGYRVVTMDLRGHGETSVPWPEYTTEAVAGDLLALIRHLDAGPAVVVANSFSAGVAVWAETELPDAVAGIAMIGPFVRDHEDAVPLVQRVGMAVLSNGPWKARSWLWFHGTLFVDSKPEDYEQYRGLLHRNLSEAGRFDALKGMLNRSDAEVQARLERVQAPSLVIMGSRDPDYGDPQEEAEWVATRLRGQVAMIEGAGHYPQAEMPAETARILLQFFEAHQLREPANSG